MSSGLAIGRVATKQWNERAVPLGDGTTPPCEGAVIDERGAGRWRFAYVSLASSGDLDLRNAVSLDGKVTNGYDALIDGSVLTIVWRGERLPRSVTPTDAFASARQDARRAVLTARHGINAVALEELTNPAGVSQHSVDTLAAAWSSAAAPLLDVAVEIALGADRQRYVDLDFGKRFQQRAASLAARLAQHGIWSHPLLTLF